MLLPFQGALTTDLENPGRCPGLGAFGPSARANNDLRPWLSLRAPFFNSGRAIDSKKTCFNFEHST